MTAVSNLVYLNGNNQLTTDSLKLAEAFGKDHGKVLRKIQNQAVEYSAEFNEANFGLVDYKDAKGENRPLYRLSRDGFMAVAMTFNGKKAAAFREEVLAEFSRMESQLIGVGLQAAAVSEDELIDRMYARLKEKDKTISHLTLVVDNEKAEHLVTKQTSKIGADEIGELEAAIKAQANSVATGLKWGGVDIRYRAKSTIQKMVKARFSGARASSTFKEITRADFQECLAFVSSLTSDLVNLSNGFDNKDAQLQALRDVLIVKGF